MYQQFALTIAISVLLSAFSALSLSPALAAMLLKPAKPARGPLGWFFGGFNRGVRAHDERLRPGARLLVRRSILTIVIVGRGRGGRRRCSAARFPAGFIPEEDQGILGVNVTLPPGVVARAHERGAGAGRGDRGQDARASSRTRRSAAMAS